MAPFKEGVGNSPMCQAPSAGLEGECRSSAIKKRRCLKTHTVMIDGTTFGFYMLEVACVNRMPAVLFIGVLIRTSHIAATEESLS